jgi:hypothetical protein
MCPRHQPNKTHQGPTGNRPDNPPIGPTGPSPDKVRRMNSERYHPAKYIGKTPDPAPGPDRGPQLHPKRYTADRTRHTMVAHRPLPPPVHDPQHDPHRQRFADFDPGGDAAMQIESPIRPPMRLTRDGRIKPRDFGRRS